MAFLILVSTSLTFQSENSISMSYSLETNKGTYCKLDFPQSLSYFLEAYGGWGENSEVAQTGKILNLDLSYFQNTYSPEQSLYYEGLEEDGEIKNAEKAFKEYEKKSWQNLDSIQISLNLFISAINSNPKFYTQIRYSKLTEKDKLTFSEVNDKMIGEYLENYLQEYAKLMKVEIMDTSVVKKEGTRPISAARSSGGSFIKSMELPDSIRTALLTQQAKNFEETHNPETEFPDTSDYIESGNLKKDLNTLLDIVQCLQKNGCTKIRFNYY